ASAYVSAHPQLAQHVGVVLNFEARGSSGPVMMFETSDGNGWLIGQMAHAAPYPIASSLIYSIYKHMPNDTDLTVFKRAGLAGMNFAFAGTYQNYHTPLDTLAQLDPDSVQHMGSYALALTRQFGNASFNEVAAPDQVYFNWLGKSMLHYPLWVAWALLLLAAVMWLLIARVVTLRNKFNKASLAIGFAGFFLTILAGMAGVAAVWWALHAWAGGRLLFGDTPSNEWIISGLVLVGVAMALLVQRGLGVRRISHEALLGTLLGFGVLSAVVSIALPGGSFLFEWPLLTALLGVGLAMLARRQHLSSCWAWLGALPVMLLFAPLLQNLLVTLGLNWVAVMVIALLLGLACAVSAPLLARLALGARWATPLLLLAAVSCLLMGLSQSHFSAAHPQRASLLYSIDADHGAAAWLSWDSHPNQWMQHLLGEASSPSKAPEFLLGSQTPVLSGPALLLPLPAPQISVRSQTTVDGVRTLDLHIVSPRQAPVLRLRLPASTRLQSLAWNHQAPLLLGDEATQAGAWQLTYAGLPANGVDLRLRLLGSDPLECHVGDLSYGLPKYAGQPDKQVMVVYGNAVMVGKRCKMLMMPPPFDGPATQ
ncbi:MAG: M28 family peptidase, partial [Xanthomonadales bacterium]|nr:M28 family peptidase [Xanthomonadales bacterium]